MARGKGGGGWMEVGKGEGGGDICNKMSINQVNYKIHAWYIVKDYHWSSGQMLAIPQN